MVRICDPLPLVPVCVGSGSQDSSIRPSGEALLGQNNRGYGLGSDVPVSSFVKYLVGWEGCSPGGVGRWVSREVVANT